jgi:hypothetical protein
MHLKLWSSSYATGLNEALSILKLLEMTVIALHGRKVHL